jgi:hypothetical protein
MIMENEFTHDEDAGMWICNDCGAYAPTAREVKHHATCQPGDARKWAEFYEKANELESQFEEEEDDWNSE